MKTAVLGEKGIEVRDLPKPAPKPNEILIKVRASSLNRADLLVASGVQHGSVGGVGARIGLECSGEVEAVGADVKDFKPGDRVMASAPGGFAEYAVTDAGRAHRIPGNNMTYEQAACFPVALQTMHNAVVTARAAQARRDAAHPGRELRRRPDGHADRQVDGRIARDGLLDQRGSGARGSRNAAATSPSIPASRIGRRTSKRRPAARAST